MISVVKKPSVSYNRATLEHLFEKKEEQKLN